MQWNARVLELLFAHGYPLLLVLFRTSGVCMLAPILGARTVPTRVRLAVSLAGAFVAYVGGGAPTLALPTSFLGILGHAAGESALGMSAGLAARITLDAAMGAGQLASLGMGFGYSAVMNPLSGVESTMLGDLFAQVAMMFAVAYGLHREAFVWLAHSVRMIPPGATVDFHHLLIGITSHGISAIALSVRMGFPILVAVTFGHMALAVTGRVATQLNLSTVGFSVAILAGGAAMYVLLPDIAATVAREAMASFSL